MNCGVMEAALSHVEKHNQDNLLEELNARAIAILNFLKSRQEIHVAEMLVCRFADDI